MMSDQTSENNIFVNKYAVVTPDVGGSIEKESAMW